MLEDDGEGLIDRKRLSEQSADHRGPTGKLKFVLDKQIVINAFQQQSPVDPIGATSGFRGTVGRRVTEVPGEWAYGDDGEGVSGGLEVDERLNGEVLNTVF